MKSRINLDRLTPEALKESVKKIKWSDDFYIKECARLRKLVKERESGKMVG